MAKIIDYLRLIRFRYHITFIVVIVGALAFSAVPWYALIKPLAIIYLAFNVLLYGGLYALNDIADINSDATHPKKRFRPLPSKAISIFEAYIFVFAFMGAGLAIAYFYFGGPIFLLFLLFITVNLIYTRLAKKIPYIEIIFNSLTYPMRFFLGALVALSSAPVFLLLAIFLAACGVSVVRRVIEKRAPGSEARRVLTYYTEQKLLILQIVCLIGIILLAALNFPLYIIWYGVIIVLYVVLVLGMYVFGQIANFYKWIFLK